MASESKSERTFVCDIRECRQYRIPPCGRLGLEARQDGSAGLWREARRAERIGDDQEAAAFTLTFASFGGETAIRARPMITNISTPYSRCARSLTVKKCLHGHSGGVSEARPCREGDQAAMRGRVA